MTADGVIGREESLPWRLPDDLKRFRALTWGCAVVMGRKTFESIGRPLPGRLNLVLSRDPQYHGNGGRCVANLDEAIRVALGDPSVGRKDELYVIGGAGPFREYFARADRLYLTTVHGDFAGDVYFPIDLLDRAEWHVVQSEEHAAADGAPAYRFEILDRVPRAD